MHPPDGSIEAREDLLPPERDDEPASVTLRRAVILLRRGAIGNPRLLPIAEDIEQVADELGREGR